MRPDSERTPIVTKRRRVPSAAWPSTGRAQRTSLCNAPETNLYFFPTGEVRVCCLNQRPLGNIARSSLLELWNGANRREVADALNGV